MEILKKNEIIKKGIAECVNIQKKITINSPTGNFFYDPWKIKPEYSGSIWEKILESLPYDLGEARIIKLDPGESYMAHADIDNRWHLNLTGEHSYLIDLDAGKMHLLELDYSWYTMDAGKIHVATNFGSIDRWQIVVRQLLQKTVETDLISIIIQPSRVQRDYRYRFDKFISPFLNKANKNFRLTDFNVDAEIVSFKLSQKEIENFKNIITEDFLVTYA